MRYWPASSLMRVEARSTCSNRIGPRFLALTLLTWKERTRPPRSTSENAHSLPMLPMFLGLRLETCLFFSLPPIRVSSTSTTLPGPPRSEEHTSELQSLMRNSYATFGLKNKINTTNLRTQASNDHTAR